MITRTNGVRSMAAAVALVAALPCGCDSTQSTTPSTTSSTAQSTTPSTTASTTAPTASSGGGDRFDPLGGAYPQISWMINVAEVDGPIGLSRSGEIVMIDDPARARAESALFTRESERRIFESLQRTPGHRFISAPFVLSRPDQRAEIGVGTRDKARQSTGDLATAVKGAIDGDLVRADVECLRGTGASAAAWQRVDGARITAGGGVVIVGPIEGRRSEAAKPIWGVVVVRPSILRSVDDYPFQTSTSISTDR